MSRIRAWIVLPLLLLMPGIPSAAAKKKEAALPTVEQATAGLQRREGLLTFFVDPARGKLLLLVPPATAPNGEAGRYLLVEGLTTGLGSNPVGLDRGQLGETRVIVLRRIGGRLLVEQPNLAYRAVSDNADESRAVEQSFARSVLWATPIMAASGDGRALVDLTSFVIRDAHRTVGRLAEADQGKFLLDRGRSAIDLDRCRAFPDNVVFEAHLTFRSDEPGRLVRQVTPSADFVTLTQHHSIVRLPDDRYRPREFDPRSGSISIGFRDYAVPLSVPVERRVIVRHRLQKTDPAAPRSAVVQPIVYHIDRGMPEPVRAAVIEGASWWAEAFDRAGFIDAFQVRLLPEDAHPLDLRYNVIQWVHRSTRGWSYGGGVVDPRTGERVKGHVNLGSLRVRQDRRIFEGLLGTDPRGGGAAGDPIQLALARIRQLAAHEVGHTIGLVHNFAASTYGRASVMDYPAPLVRVGADGNLDVSNAYAVGIGDWDAHAIRYSYATPAPGEDAAVALLAIVEDGFDQGLLFLTDRDARAPGSAQPMASLWDNGEDPIDELEQVLAVRRVALDRFGEDNVAVGRPLALLQEVLAPIYLYHRYQVEAAIKVVGGVDYRYSVRGDGQPHAKPIAGDRQRRAIRAVMETLSPAQLDLPDSVLEVLLPRPNGYGDNRELFEGRTGQVFDPIAAAASAADLVLDLLLHPERGARMADLHRRDPELPGFDELLRVLVDQLFAPSPTSPRHMAIRHEIQRTAVEAMIALSGDAGAAGTVRAAVDLALVELKEWLESVPAGDDRGARAQRLYVAARIGRHIDRTGDDDGGEPAEAPPGSPIGGIADGLFRDCSQYVGDAFAR